MISMAKKNPEQAGKGSETEIPADLRKVLASAPKADDIWKDLTPIARRDFISWIDSAKQAETRKRRVGSVPSRLLSGKRRPCCYAIVPMNLYKALDADPKAKSKWKILPPERRRDFTDWISSARDKDEAAVRIVKACGAIAAGKQQP